MNLNERDADSGLGRKWQIQSNILLVSRSEIFGTDYEFQMEPHARES